LQLGYYTSSDIFLRILSFNLIIFEEMSNPLSHFFVCVRMRMYVCQYV